jgi:FkbM family methyltransferase
MHLAGFFSSHPLTRNAPIRAWARFAAWQLKSRMNEEVIVPWIAEQQLVVRRGMTGATGNIYVGLHEFVDMMFLLHFLREGDLFLDIGANVGSYTVLASGVCRAHTWAFEPDPETARNFKRNVAINNLESLVRLYELALGASKEDIYFTIGRDTMNKVAAVNEQNQRLVHQEKLDTLTGSVKPLMIKMDVEGYEEEVLRGAQVLLSKDFIKAIELETVTPGIAKLLFKNEFVRAYYDPFRRRLAQQPAGVATSNSLFVRQFDFVASRLASANKVTVLDHTI